MRPFIFCFLAILCTCTVQAQKSPSLYTKAKAALEVYDYTTALISLAAFREVNKPKSDSNEEFWLKVNTTYAQVTEICKERVGGYTSLQRQLMNCEPRAVSVTGHMLEPTVDQLPPLTKRLPQGTFQPRVKKQGN